MPYILKKMVKNTNFVTQPHKTKPKIEFAFYQHKAALKCTSCQPAEKSGSRHSGVSILKAIKLRMLLYLHTDRQPGVGFFLVS